MDISFNISNIEEPEATVVRKPTKTDEAVDYIRSKIIDLTVPPGSRIDERLLIEQFKLGRTPAREAINRLQAEGFVKIVADGGGKYVRDLGMSEIGEILAAHQTAETMLASLCNFDDKTLVDDLTKIQNRYAQSIAEMNYLLITEINQEFHSRLFRSINNSFLYDFAQSVHRHVRRLLVMIYKIESMNPDLQTDQFEENLDEHWKIIEMISQHDRAALKTALPNHALQTQRRLSAFLEMQTKKGANVDFVIPDAAINGKAKRG